MEHQSWHVLETVFSQMRVGPAGGVLGIDLTAAIAVAGLYEYDVPAVVEILSAAEPGIVSALNASDDLSGGDQQQDEVLDDHG